MMMIYTAVLFECIDQGLHTELVCSTYKYISHISSYPIQVKDDPYCNVQQVIDQGLHTELVCNIQN